MIRPPGTIGVAFTDAGDGDQRGDPRARASVAEELGIATDWASVRQMHGTDVFEVTCAGEAGDGDALWTSESRLPLAVFTADCFGLTLIAPGAVGVAHAGWRGARGGVVTALRSAMADAGHSPHQAAIGPGIGSCCFEVGDEVASQFEGFTSHTSEGATSVDLRAAVRSELEGLEVWESSECTRHDPGWYSHRRDATPFRLATLAWLP
jgi:YfiH family protein